MKLLVIFLLIILVVAFTPSISEAQIQDDNQVKEILGSLTSIDEKGDYQTLIGLTTSVLDYDANNKAARFILKRSFIKYFDKILWDDYLVEKVLRYYKNIIPPNFEKLLIWYYNKNSIEKINFILEQLPDSIQENEKIDMWIISSFDPEINSELYKRIVDRIFPYTKNFSYPRMILVYYNTKMLDVKSISSIISLDTIKNDLTLNELSLFNPLTNPEDFNLIYQKLIKPKVIENLDSINNPTELIRFCKQCNFVKDIEYLNLFVEKLLPSLDLIQNELELYEFAKALFSINKKPEADKPFDKIYSKINQSTLDLGIKFTWAISSLNKNDTYRAEKFLDEIFLYASKSDIEYFKKEVEWWILQDFSKEFLTKSINKYFINQQKETIPVDKKEVADTTFGMYHALIIGISDYTCPNIPDLQNPISDSERIAEVLKNKYSFSDKNIIILKNPTREIVLSNLTALRKKLGEKDNLLIFYAGHGQWDENMFQGYWLPSDAEVDNPINWISNSDIRNFVRAIKTKHTLLITDACFSGAIFKERELITSEFEEVKEVYKYRSRRAITSGTINPVPDRSVFLDYLIKRLNDNQSNYLLARSLFLNLRAAVINNSPNRQVPVYGIIHEAGDEGSGDFIFKLKHN